MFRFLFLVLAGVGLGALIFGEGSWGLGLLLLFPVLLLAKVAFILLLFGFFGRMMWHRGRPGWRGPSEWHAPRREGPPSWQRPRWGDGGGEAGPAGDEARFEEWHRMAHAREEVDSWAPEE
jgi:hypothetical protein